LNNPPALDINLGVVHLVGVGAIGNGFMWGVARMNGLSGELHCVDAECVDESNPQRYVIALPTDVHSLKVDLAEREAVANGSQVRVRKHAVRWGHFLGAQSTMPALDRVAVALDSARDRIAVQASLPRKVFNAWTQAGDLGISRHTMNGPTGCLACMYIRDGASKNEDQLVAEAIGMPERLLEVRAMLHSGAAVGVQGVHEIAVALSIAPESLMAFASKPLRAFYTEAICGGIVLRLQGGSNMHGATEVPMAFQSALAGILLAAAVVADSAAYAEPAGTKATIDLLRPLGTHLTVPVAPHKSGRCICQDPDYREAYANKHGLT
jgi:molybdopterin/thiamine biosynthesis adenylyltransferase